MFYSESKERGNRFLIALKITFPFLIFTLYLFSMIKLNNNLMTILLLTFLIPIYTYYIFYLIYTGFKTTLIDRITKTFNRREILKLIKEEISKKNNSTIVLLSIENIYDINRRYGANNTDTILSIFAKKIDGFLVSCNLKNIPIGRHSGGNFLLIVKHGEKELKHFLRTFSRELKNRGINDIEIKMEFSLVKSSYDIKIENIIKKLFSLVDEEKEKDFKISNIRPNEFESIVFNAIKNENFFIKYQPSKNIQNKKIEIYEVLVKIDSKNYGLISRRQAEKAINFGGFEKTFDKKIVNFFIEEIREFDDENIFFSLDISPVSLRNNDFRVYLKDAFKDTKTKPKNIILEINERSVYKDLKRFNEILLQYKKAGFLIALNNFAGNNCSIEYLKNLPIDIVKFDIEYIKQINNEKYKIILENLLELCDNLNIKTMMKFIDKKELYDSLSAIDPTYIQGFYISKPKSIDEILEKKVK